ncbi:hypothetical protein AB1Y20_003499 [Prymnesium parvum]|uniref:Formamidopyrimidine-DNA glycosylase catalytic domain-containing protein n=1 Tax=Prymnesium parvum TaxID=97485 RepID=A0AB34JB29_PRYPA
MPELPEAEATRRLLAATAVGRQVRELVLTDQRSGARDGLFDDRVYASSAAAFASALGGAFVVGAARRGKQLWLSLARSAAAPPHAALLIHLGMTGACVARGVRPLRFASFRVEASVWPPRHTKLELRLDDGGALAYADPRRLGRIALAGGEPLGAAPLALLARDPLIDPPARAEFGAALRRFPSAVKAVLLDQRRLVCGVGNWVADEVLFHARVLPSARAAALSDAQCRAIHEALLRVCREACECEADSSRFPATWLFHHRWARQTTGSIDSPLGRIHFATVAGRTTAFVPSVQRGAEGCAERNAPSRGGESKADAAGRAAETTHKGGKRKSPSREACGEASVRTRGSKRRCEAL